MKDFIFDLQRFDATTITPTATTGDLKDGSTITVKFKDNFGDDNTATFTYNKANNSFSETHSGWFIEGARANIDGSNIVIQLCAYYGESLFDIPNYINTITLDTFNNKWTFSEGSNAYSTSNYSFAFNGTTIPYDNSNNFASSFSEEICDVSYTITIGEQTYSVEFDDKGNLTTVNGEDLVDGKVTLGDKEYNFSGTTSSVTYSEVINDDDDGGDDTDDTVTSGVIYNNKKNTKLSTSATITSDFDGDTYDATKYRRLETIKVAGKFSGDIEIIGNSKANKITGGKGDDTIDGGIGYDKINGGKGDDSINGGNGNDKLDGEDGDDSIDGGKGEDKIYGGKGYDTLRGGKSNDTLTGGKGADIFVYKKGDGHDVITDYTAGEDTVSLDSDFKASVEGNNVILKVGRGTITLEKTVGKKVTVNDETKIYRAEGTYDEDETKLEFFSTFNGNFKASAYKNLEVLDASAVKNKAVSIIGNDKDNSITGGSKSDSLSGGKGNDSLDGGTGNDTLIGGEGNDTLTGGSGINIFVYESGNDVITDFAGNSKIKLLNASVTTDYEFSGNDLVLNFDSGSLTIQNYDGKAIKFLDATDNKSEYVFTEDALYNGTKTRATLVSGNTFTADKKIFRIDGSQVGNSIDITGNHNKNLITGNDKGNTIDGGKGSDSIKGGKSNDTLIGGLGNDKLWGNGGADTFIYEKGDGHDVIFGFGNDDELLINGFDESDILPVYNAKDNSVYVKLGTGSVKLKEFTATEFNIGSSTWQLSGKTLTRQ